MKKAGTPPGPHRSPREAKEEVKEEDKPSEQTELDDSLTFAWPERSASFVLPIFFLLAVLCHAAAFYLFQIVYPPSTAVTPPTAQLLYISPDTPENLALLQWVDAQLPATVARVRDTPLPPELRPIRYTPSYETPGTQPKGAELIPPTVPYPLAYNTTSHLRPTTPQISSPSTPPKTAVPSTLHFSESLRPFQNPAAPPLPPLAPPSSGTPESPQHKPQAEPLHIPRTLHPTRYFVGLNPRGELHYTFAQESSGNKALDQKAAAYLNNYPFAHPAETPAAEITWGTLTFIWGADAYNFESPSTSSTAPPSPAAP